MNTSKNNIDRMLSSPLVLWIISVTAALSLWFYVNDRGEANYITQKISLPLEYRSVDPQAALSSRVNEVEVEIRGLDRDISRLNTQDIACFVDARNLTPGMRYTQQVRIILPRNVTLVSCVPSQVVIDLVRQIVRLIPVELTLPPNMPIGQYLDHVELLPKEIGVKGSERDVAKVASLNVMPTADELQLGRELLLPVRFNQSEPFDADVTLEPAQVRVRASLARGLPKKRVPINVRFSGEQNDDYVISSITTDPYEAQIEGSAEQLAGISEVYTELVDISGASDSMAVVVPLRAPDAEGVSLSGAKSVRVNVKFDAAKAVRQLVNIPVTVKGAESPRKWQIRPDSVTIAIETLPSLIDSVSAEALGLKAHADVSNIFVSSAALPVRAEITSADAAGKFSVVRIEPQIVEVSRQQ